MKTVLFYRQGSVTPFWKIRTPHVSEAQIDTLPLPGAAQPRCGKGMLVTVDGELYGVVESVARLGGSTVFRIALRREIGESEWSLLLALKELALHLDPSLADDGDAALTPVGLAQVDAEDKSVVQKGLAAATSEADVVIFNAVTKSSNAGDKPSEPAKRKPKRKRKTDEGEK